MPLPIPQLRQVLELCLPLSMEEDRLRAYPLEVHRQEHLLAYRQEVRTYRLPLPIPQPRQVLELFLPLPMEEDRLLVCPLEEHRQERP